MPTRLHILPPNPSRLIEGLRDTGYDFNTALADIIDNSVDAKASLIDIRIQMDTDGEILISVADNGCGMDESTLLDGMTYGAKGRIDPRRLGKFGLGLKTASTAFAKRLSVITRPSKNAEAMKATWDLEHVVKESKWELLLDNPTSSELTLLKKVAKESSGTLVIWDNIDRLLKPYSVQGGKHAQRALEKIISDFDMHAGMVYQRFLNPQDDRVKTIKMTLNGRTIEAWDPFCEGESGTELVAEENNVEVELQDKTKTSFSIRAFVLPRREQFSNLEAAKKARLANNMQGIYIYRENRLIHPADWLGMFSKEPHFTLLRVEFSFDHLLDEAFQVDIKKSRILLNDDLYNWVLNNFLPAPRNAADERYRKGTKKKVEDQAKNAHADSNQSIGSKEEDIRIADVEVTDPDTNEVQVTNPHGQVRFKLKISSPTNKGEVNVQTTDSIEDGLLWEPALIDSHHAVRINTGHPYYHKVYVPNYKSGVTIQGMDALLWALVEAELGTVNKSTINHLHELKYEVSRLLRKLVDDLPEPDIEENEIND